MKEKIICCFCDSKEYGRIKEVFYKEHLESCYLKCKGCGKIFGYHAYGDTHLDMRYQMKMNILESAKR